MKRFSSIIFAGMSAILNAPTAWAQVPVPNTPTSVAPCFINGLPCGGGGAAGASAYAFSVIIPAAQYVFLAAAILFFFYYAIRLMLESEDESTITETKSAYGYGVAGAAAVSLASLIVQAVGPGYATSTLVNSAPIITIVDIVVFYLRLMVSTAVSALIVFQGIRLILLQGQESEVEQQKKRFFHGLLGVAIILLANVVVAAFAPGAGSVQLAIEIVGIANFLLEILGALCVLAFIIAGIMLVVSTEDGLKDRAKKAMFTTVITLILVLSSYIIVNFVIGL